MRILLVEDDKTLHQTIAALLKKEGMTVDSSFLGEEGMELIKLYDYDLVILDLMLPDMPGYDVLKQIRAAGIQTPVLVLSGLTLPTKKVECFGNGADDYLTKPFDKTELVARIQAIVRRAKGHADSVVRTGGLEVNLNTKTVSVHGKPLNLTSKEYALLEFLCLKKGTTISKEQFLNHLYGGMDEPEIKIIDVFVCKMRRKMDRLSGGEEYIQTVWGRGYVLRDI
ncbi:MAG: response regulator transcription factor [Alphaproteobacteria bacterium]|nr:response regulator transcription factor [Alphaproteobacteria bacterium]